MQRKTNPTNNSSFSFARWLERQWYRIGPWQALLLPLSFLFWLLVLLRRALYRTGLRRVEYLPVPVVVVGNITVGGSGKTPLVLWLAGKLRDQGFHPGIISRGYGSTQRQEMEVFADSDALCAGDEPVLLAQKSGCPVWVGADRIAAAKSLIQAHSDCDVIISDDGLQHYRLGRNVEIVVVDGMRRFGNGLPLPAGPLREAVSRLASADAVVVNGGNGALPRRAKRGFAMRLAGAEFFNLANPARHASAEELSMLTLHAVAGIGNPARFFAQLHALGLSVEQHPFPDHHVFQPHELEFPGQVLMTEKDAVKCVGFAKDSFWVLAVQAEVPDDLARLVGDKVRRRNGQQTA